MNIAVHRVVGGHMTARSIFQFILLSSGLLGQFALAQFTSPAQESTYRETQIGKIFDQNSACSTTALPSEIRSTLRLYVQKAGVNQTDANSLPNVSLASLVPAKNCLDSLWHDQYDVKPLKDGWATNCGSETSNVAAMTPFDCKNFDKIVRDSVTKLNSSDPMPLATTSNTTTQQ
jgi:hypothetical protein